MAFQSLTAFGRTVHPTTHLISTGSFKTSYRVWGTGPIRAIFFHGGPGQAVVDYQNTNIDILDPTLFTVVEPDQLGTGSSLPSIRDSILNAEMYQDSKPEDIASALALVLDHLGWKEVYLHGGSWGSTLALLFAQMYPERVIGMVLRGIWLGTKEELEYFYDPEAIVDSQNGRLARSEMTRYIISRGFQGNPNSAYEVVPFYRSLLLKGTELERDVAAFNYWVHERFFMDECEPGFFQNGDYEKLVTKHEMELKEARSVAYWELTVTAFFLISASWNLVQGVKKIPPHIPVDIVHGKHDFLCPVKHAKSLEAIFKENGNRVNANYVDSGHKVTNNAIREAVKEAASRFAKEYHKK